MKNLTLFVFMILPFTVFSQSASYRQGKHNNDCEALEKKNRELDKIITEKIEEIEKIQLKIELLSKRGMEDAELLNRAKNTLAGFEKAINELSHKVEEQVKANEALKAENERLKQSQK